MRSVSSATMFAITKLSICLYAALVGIASGSTLAAPPLSAVVIAFENEYDLSLLANTLSDEGIDSIFITLPYGDVYDNAVDVEIIPLNVSFNGKPTLQESPEIRALHFCKAFLTDEKIHKKMQEFQPTFTIFPALRHDGCLLPWAKSIQSIPVIWTGSPDEEFYAFRSTGVALPVRSGYIWTRLFASFTHRSMLSTARYDYALPALQIAEMCLPNMGGVDLESLYADVRLVLWGMDTVFRSDFASLTQLLVEVGCHHCKPAYPLPTDLHNSLLDFRLGAVIALLDDNYDAFLLDLAQKLPQGRQGLVIVWKNKAKKSASKQEKKQIAENFFSVGRVDRQDLIGYSRARVLLSHCSDSEILESAFHGTPVICFPRNAHETRNAARVVELGFAGWAKTSSLDDAAAKEVAATISEIHETITYRENARKVSLAIRDRLNPPSDRLTYWLRYVARTKDIEERYLSAVGYTGTFHEDYRFVWGFSVGSVAGIAIGLALSAYVHKHRFGLNGRAKKLQEKYG